MKKAVFVSLGFLAIGIAVIGRFTPGLPTTPFLLLALYFFNKSSERMSNWLKNTSFYKKYLSEYVQQRAMTLKQKLSIQILASIMMAISFVLVPNIVFRIALIVAFLIHHYVFIFRIKTYKPEVLSDTNISPPAAVDKSNYQQ